MGSEQPQSAQTVTIYKAPQKGKGQKLLKEGFQPLDFPYNPPYFDGNCYFAGPNDRSTAEEFNQSYREGILERMFEKYQRFCIRPLNPPTPPNPPKGGILGDFEPSSPQSWGVRGAAIGTFQTTSEVMIDQASYYQHFKPLEYRYDEKDNCERIEVVVHQNLFPILNQFSRILKPR